MKILVTGGAGFIASHVVDAYLKLGHRVIVVDDLSRGQRSNVAAAARFHFSDIRNREQLDRIFREEKPDVVNHHAAQMDVRRGVREPIYDAQVNILGSLNLLEAAVSNGVRRIIYGSTAGAAYGEPTSLPVSEEHSIDPITPYGISKHTVEHYLYTFSVLYQLPYVVLRYGNVYGPRQNSAGEAGVFAIFSEQMLAGVTPVIYGDGSKVRDYVYVDDVVQANVAALDHGTGQIFNIGSGQPTSDYEVFSIVRRLIGVRNLEAQFTSKRPGEIDRIYLDISKARRLLGWSPRVNLEEGAGATVRYFQVRSRPHSAVDAAAMVENR
jgi:UDP-glucose 4-epimerase